jgi:hypothetical protein
MSKLFRCKITNYSIKFDLHPPEAIMGETSCNYVNIKAWLLLLRRTIDSLKSQAITHITQGVTQEDWDLYLKDKTTWTIKDTGAVSAFYITCPIDDFLTNYTIAMGINN